MLNFDSILNLSNRDENQICYLLISYKLELVGFLILFYTKIIYFKIKFFDTVKEFAGVNECM